MSLLETSNASYEGLVQGVRDSIAAVADHFQARAWGDLPLDAPFQPLIPAGIDLIPYKDALARFDQTCRSVTSTLEAAIGHLDEVLNCSLTLQLAASLTQDDWDEMDGFDDRLDGLIGEWADSLCKSLTRLERVGSTLGLYSQALGGLIGEEGEEMTLHQACLISIECRRLTQQFEHRRETGSST